MQAIAFMVVTDENMIQVRDAQTASEENLRRINPKKILNILIRFRISLIFFSNSLLRL
jgi:hypothetical protein